MSSPTTEIPLDNDPSNPCIGCGPENPVGLRLTFARQGDVVATTLLASPDYQGWPGRLHSGLLYLALLETANWTAFALRDRVGLPTRTGALEAVRLVRTGERLRLSGRSAAPTLSPLEITVEATDEQGTPVARIVRTFEFPGRAEFLKRLGYDSAPAQLQDLLPA